MVFVVRGYETEEARGGLNSDTWVLQIRVQDDVTDFQPDGSVRNLGPPTQDQLPITVLSTPNRDFTGIAPRGVKVRWTEQAPPGYKLDGSIFVPILRRNRYQIYRLGMRVRFRGGTGVIVGKISEQVRI